MCYFFWQINPIGMWQELSNHSPSRVPNNIFPIPAQFSTNLPFGSLLSQPWNPFSSVWSSQIHLPSFTESESPIQYIPSVTKNSSFKNLLMALFVIFARKPPYLIQAAWALCQVRNSVNNTKQVCWKQDQGTGSEIGKWEIYVPSENLVCKLFYRRYHTLIVVEIDDINPDVCEIYGE